MELARTFRLLPLLASAAASNHRGFGDFFFPTERAESYPIIGPIIINLLPFAACLLVRLSEN